MIRLAIRAGVLLLLAGGVWIYTVRGEAILMALLGRTHSLDELAGDGVAMFAQRVKSTQPATT